VAAALTDLSRQGDGIYRYGGEEFLLMLPEQDTVAAAVALERLRATVQEEGITHSGSPTGVLTISAGISTYVSGSGMHSEGLLRQADLALYQAKMAGRNRVSVAGGPSPSSSVE